MLVHDVLQRCYCLIHYLHNEIEYILCPFTPVRALKHDVKSYICTVGTYSNRVVQFVNNSSVGCE